MHAGDIVNSTTATSDTSSQFRYYFHCSGKEREVSDCIMSEIDTNLCDEIMVATLQCDTGDAELISH